MTDAGLQIIRDTTNDATENNEADAIENNEADAIENAEADAAVEAATGDNEPNTSWETLKQELSLDDREGFDEPPNLLDDADLALVSSRGLRYLLGGLIADGAKPADLRVWLSSIVVDDRIWAGLDEQWEALQMTEDKVDEDVEGEDTSLGYVEGEDASLGYVEGEEASLDYIEAQPSS